MTVSLATASSAVTDRRYSRSSTVTDRRYSRSSAVTDRRYSRSSAVTDRRYSRSSAVTDRRYSRIGTRSPATAPCRGSRSGRPTVQKTNQAATGCGRFALLATIARRDVNFTHSQAPPT